MPRLACLLLYVCAGALRDRVLTQRIADKISRHALQIEPQLAGALQETLGSA